MVDSETKTGWSLIRARVATRRCRACRKRYRRRLPNCPTCKTKPGLFNDRGPMNYSGFGGEGAAWRDKWFR